jgi:predicted GNAT family N-acyltransferase
LKHADPSRPFTIEKVDWSQDKARLSAIRTEVFIVEQQVPPDLEWDNLDETAIHLLALDADGRGIGCARILESNIIGRMAVCKTWRRHGVGGALLATAIHLCRQRSHDPIRLSAQTHAIPFYERAGFLICSEEYPDAGIPHRDMQLT